MIRVVHPGSWIPGPDADFLPIPDPGSKGQKGIGSRIRIRNTGAKVPNVSCLRNSFTFPSGEESMVVEVELPPAVASAPEEPEVEDEDKPEEEEEEGDEETKSR
jgi:hypothetical protein